MKAKKIEIPTSSWYIATVLLALIVWMSLDTIYANEDLPIRVKVDTVGAFDNHRIDIDNRTTQDIEHEMRLEGDTIRQERELEEQRQRELAEQRERERLAAIAEAIAREEARYSQVGVCSIGSFKKTYMGYRMIHPGSRQMSIINNYTSLSDDGFLVTDDGFIGVALGSTYGELGAKYRVTTDTGQVFKVIKVDEKADAHTVNGCHDASGAMIEFVVNADRIASSYPRVTMSGDFNSLSRFNGTIVKIERYI